MFKNEFNQKGEIENTIYINTLIMIFKEQNDYFQKEIEKQPKKNKTNKTKQLVESKESEESINLEIENMLKEIDENKDIESKSNNSIVCKSNSISIAMKIQKN